ncbi:urease accessory protein [Phyllobacterium bourgognense]|uniref:Urease accessory protein UreD n=1 Tax=Phyllobacterium bourgognense TaxID=314236 RepID=A0A368YQ82_9HYPH|nr:urease accessory protein UreD [Phyllobacterium bourgognense]RCW82381.1 urease accessory protein [Phyllobacterium bourgognense]
MTGWCAELELWFEKSHGLTRLVRRRHVGPLAVQRPFYPEADGSAHVYLLHPPGGVAGGDQLAINCHLGPRACTVLTTPGATKFYRSQAGLSTQHTTINVGVGAICEYLPQETILFDGADVSINTRISLAADAIYLGWEFFSFGRPACGERFLTGSARQRLEIARDGSPIWFEQLRVSGTAARLLDEPFAFAGQPIVGTMVYAGPMIENAVGKMRETLGHAARHVFAVTQLERVIVCRYLGNRMSEGKALFLHAWDALREGGIGKGAAVPRIWAT